MNKNKNEFWETPNSVEEDRILILTILKLWIPKEQAWANNQKPLWINPLVICFNPLVFVSLFICFKKY